MCACMCACVCLCACMYPYVHECLYVCLHTYRDKVCVLVILWHGDLSFFTIQRVIRTRESKFGLALVLETSREVRIVEHHVYVMILLP